MASLSLRIRDDLKRKAQTLARRHGVSLNNFVNATLAAAVAQEETLAFFDDRSLRKAGGGPGSPVSRSPARRPEAWDTPRRSDGRSSSPPGTQRWIARRTSNPHGSRRARRGGTRRKRPGSAKCGRSGARASPQGARPCRPAKETRAAGPSSSSAHRRQERRAR